MLRHGEEILGLENLIENFSLFDNWEDRYRYLIDLGRGLPKLPEGMKTPEALVKGCTAPVWLYVCCDAQGLVRMQADSEAHIVRGLAALLMAAYDGEDAARIGALDIEDAFTRMGLAEHLSPNRRSGFFAMVQRLKGPLQAC